MSFATSSDSRQTAAWRLSIGTTFAFALGTAVAFVIIYLFVANSVRERTDAWLSGEAETLADVAMNTSRDNLYSRVIAEAAELATREVPDEGDAEKGGVQPRSVFFLQLPLTGSSDKNIPLWIGPGSQDLFVRTFEHIH